MKQMNDFTNRTAERWRANEDTERRKIEDGEEANPDESSKFSRLKEIEEERHLDELDEIGRYYQERVTSEKRRHSRKKRELADKLNACNLRLNTIICEQ